MRAILINPENRSLTEIQIEDDWKASVAALDCDLMAIAYNFNKQGLLEDSILVDDEGLLKPGLPVFLFRDVTLGSVHLAGRGLVQAYNTRTGESADAMISLFDLAEKIEWTDQVTTGDAPPVKVYSVS